MKVQIVQLTAFLAMFALLSGAASATQSDMEALPSYSVYGCILCHTSTSGGSLNAFGSDFNDNGRLWTYDLAIKDSDGDSCTNGSELGDVDGNVLLDEGITEESSNPGSMGDCSSASIYDEVTWGQLKAMFDTR